ncbi:MAG: ribosome biogenesis GTPase Der [Rhodanobacteraceae bacterium]
MEHNTPLPVVALVGRPNVGKSTLFNALTRRRDALVADLPGVTRDRHYGVSDLGMQPFMLVDTGGLGGADARLDNLTEHQVRLAIEEADALLMMVDARDGLQVHDQAILDELRRSGKPLLLLINKIDGVDEATVSAEFTELGVAGMLAISASHRRGLDAVVEALDRVLPDALEAHGELPEEGMRVAILGRPNAGKSTLVNRLLGEDRLVVSEVAGTTRDSIRVALERDGQRYTLIDTAGIRRKTRAAEAIEKFSIIKALKSIQAAEVVVVLVDAHENLAEQDLSLIGHVLEAGRGLVIALNKWDGMEPYDREQCKKALDRRLEFVSWAPQVTISALHGSGLRELMRAVGRAHESATREFATAELTRAIEAAYRANPPPLVRGHAPKLRFAHPGGSNPPTIIVHGSRTQHVSASYKRYLENFMRKRFKLVGTPVRIDLRDGDNPFAGRKNKLSERQIKKRQRLIRHSRRK